MGLIGYNAIIVLNGYLINQLHIDCEEKNRTRDIREFIKQKDYKFLCLNCSKRKSKCKASKISHREKKRASNVSFPINDCYEYTLGNRMI